jgi:hypothetical protein
MVELLITMLEIAGFIIALLCLVYYIAYYACRGWYKARPNIPTNVYINPEPVAYNCNCSAAKDGQKMHYDSCRSWLNKTTEKGEK